MKIKTILFSGLLLSSSLFANEDRFYDYAKVKYSQPIYEYVYHNEPYEECKKVRYKVRNDDYSYDDHLGVDTLVGVAAGAVIGSQIGKGNGRVASQIVGGLLGGKVAHEIRNNYNPHHSNYKSYETRTECYNRYNSVGRKELTGYKNFFVYKGVEHYKITSRPIRRVKITHIIDF
jgi:uncharacterized protein YcfJ